MAGEHVHRSGDTPAPEPEESSSSMGSGMRVLSHSETVDGQHMPAGATVQVSNFVNPTSYKPSNVLDGPDTGPLF
ncbi:hypothetical protein ACIBEA_43055 [Streptomyces sp. NPDC051555]|uniref:hypothetical protein n=1 Tax=Streptomyces sp. NPDC051555 TaxID=3365657 RepID=UPI00379E22FD